MLSTDPIADMLTRIRNAISVNKTEVNLPYSRLKETIALQLKAANFIDDVKSGGEGIDKSITISINKPGTNARITEIDRMSKPGRRMYVKSDEIPTIKSGRGIVLVSTSKGVMTGNAAKASKIGGEVICKVY